MINQKKAKKLRRLLGVIAHDRREYVDHDGTHHRFPHDGKMTIGTFKKIRVNWQFPKLPGTITLPKASHRGRYQRIKRQGIATPIINARTA